MSIPNPVLNLDLSVDTATGSTTARTLADRAADVVNAKNFGATGNATTNDTAAIQAAANAIPATGGVLYIPAGTYLVRATILIKSNTVVRGDGPGSCLLADTSWPLVGLYSFLLNANYAATVITDHDIDVEDMQFDYGAFGPIGVPGGGKHQLRFQFTRNVRVSRCTFQTRGAENATSMVGCANTLITACSAYDFINCGYDHWWGPQNGRVIGCFASSAGSSQVVNWNPEATTGSSVGLSANGFVLADNEFVTTGATAMPIQLEPLGPSTTASNIVVTGNVFNNIQLAVRGATRNVTIAGNTFIGTKGGASVIASYVKNSVTPTDIIVSGNNITDPETVGGNVAVLRIWATDAIITGNRISGSSYGSVSGIDTSTFVAVVAGNSISNGVQNTNSCVFVAPNVTATALNGAVIGATTPAAASVTQLNLTTSAGPNIRSGAGAGSGTQPKGSIWMRTDGGVGTTMYVSQGAGVWNAVAAV